jgi:hypoxanthine phosphoribosyltransferase
MDLSAELEQVRREARELYSADEVRTAIRVMAGHIAAELAGTNPLVVAVMHGGVFTAVHLSEQFQFAHEFDYVHVSRYGAALSGGDLEWIVGPKAICRGRVVLLVDDVLDRGVTLAALHAELKRMPVAKLCTAVLVSKEADVPAARPAVDYVGLRAGKEYLFGCGMDYKGYWRNLRSLYAVVEPPTSRARAASQVGAASGREDRDETSLLQGNTSSVGAASGRDSP